MNKRALGTEKEKLACDYLKKKGYHIVETNFFCRRGEIDIIAKDGEYLVFVEVKYRKNADFGGGLYAVSKDKIRKISQTAGYYMLCHNIATDMPVRFDVIAMDGENITHIANAFEYMEI